MAWALIAFGFCCLFMFLLWSVCAVAGRADEHYDE